MELKQRIYYSKYLLAGFSTIICNTLTILAFIFGFGHAQALGVAFGWGILIPYYFIVKGKLNDEQIIIIGGKKKIILEGIGGYVSVWVCTWTFSYMILHFILWPEYYTPTLLGPTFFPDSPYYLTTLLILGIFLLKSTIVNLITRKMIDLQKIKRYTNDIEDFKEKKRKLRAIEKILASKTDKEPVKQIDTEMINGIDAKNEPDTELEQDSDAKLEQKAYEDAHKTRQMLKIKILRKQKYIEKITRHVMTQRLKPMLIFFVVFIVIGYLLLIPFGNTTAGIFPFDVGKIPFFNYFIRSPPNTYLPMGFPLSFIGFYYVIGVSLTPLMHRLFGTYFTV